MTSCSLLLLSLLFLLSRFAGCLRLIRCLTWGLLWTRSLRWTGCFCRVCFWLVWGFRRTGCLICCCIRWLTRRFGRVRRLYFFLLLLGLFRLLSLFGNFRLFTHLLLVLQRGRWSGDLSLSLHNLRLTGTFRLWLRFWWCLDDDDHLRVLDLRIVLVLRFFRYLRLFSRFRHRVQSYRRTLFLLLVLAVVLFVALLVLLLVGVLRFRSGHFRSAENEGRIRFQ